jgi:hypothetical protein
MKRERGRPPALSVRAFIAVHTYARRRVSTSWLARQVGCSQETVIAAISRRGAYAKPPYCDIR